MENNKWYDCFLKILSMKYPKKVQLAEKLMDLLYLERETVYRRLRKDVVFNAHEIVKIASEWNISLDEIISINSDRVSFQMYQMDYLDPSDPETKLLQEVIDGLHRTTTFPDAELMNVCNVLPRPVLAGYRYLNQFHLFRWIYQYGNTKDVIPFSQVVISERKRQITSDYRSAVQHVPSTSHIFDPRIFENLINDIQYFYYIHLITDEEKELIKKDLYTLLDYMWEVVSKGYYPETKGKVNLYISRISIDTNYSYIYTEEANISFVHAFDKYELYTFNSEMFEKFKTWMALKKRTSIQISGVDEMSRIEFFKKQRQIVESL